MASRIRAGLIFLCLVALGPLQTALGAPWVAADWGGREPKFPPGSLHWHTNQFEGCPVLYRTVITVPKRAIRYAGFRIRASWFAYIYLDGSEIAHYLQKGEGAVTDPFDVELTHRLRPGPHALVVSTTADGFSLEGGVVFEKGGRQGLASDIEAWKVQKFPPLTMLEYEPCMLPGFDDSEWFSVKAADREPVALSDAELALVCQRLGGKRLQRSDDNARWRLKMLNEKGIPVVDWVAYGWAGAARLPDEVRKWSRSHPVEGGTVRDLADALTAYVRLSDEATNLENHVVGLKALNAPTEHIALCRRTAARLRRVLEDMAKDLDEGHCRFAAAAAAGGKHELAQAHKAFLFNDLCSCLDNKFGWFDNNRLMDNDIGEWGIRVNPVDVSWKMDLDGKWRFKVDPNDTGLQEKRHTFGYNIENQWPELNVPGAWENQGIQQANPKAASQSPYPGVNERSDGPYNGYAWYRKTVRVPKEWAGHDLQLHVSVIDDWDWAYFNGTQIGHTGAKTKGWWRVPRTYRIPKTLVQFGGINTIAIRIYDCGAKGVIGSVELRCPGLEAAYVNKPKVERKPTAVFASPLSPAALLTVGERDLVMWGWDQRGVAGPRGLMAVIGGTPTVRSGGDGVLYDRAKDGDLGENWALLLTSGKPGDEPIQLVFLEKPARIAFNAGGRGTDNVTVWFETPGARLLALRPLNTDSSAASEPSQEEAARTCRFWSQALLHYPVTFSEAFVRDPDDKWALRVTDVYDYWDLKDAWGTKPIRIAPLPPLASYGLKTKYPGLELISEADRTGYSLGRWGDLAAAVGSDHILYRVPLDPIKRYGGFTSFCFSAADIGVPGNIKEIETIKRSGANSYRPQHNQNGERAMKVAQWCWEQGIQNVFNVDNQYAVKDAIFDHYRKLAEQCKDLPPDAVAYDLINEPANMEPSVYNPRIRELIRTIREVDKTHLIYVETPHSFASISQFANLAPTEDQRTCYSFHDYDYRLPPRWPNERTDIRNILDQWIPAFKYSIDHRRPIHLGEFGGFEQTEQSVYDNPCALTLMTDFFRIFDQFGWHWHYYANRGTVRVREDGSLQDSWVQEAHRRYFAKGTFNINRQP